MTKREYIFKFLDKVKGHWEKEPIIRDYLLKNDDETYTEYLYLEFTKIVDDVIRTKGEMKMGGMVKSLDNIKNQERRFQEADALDLENLEKLINSL